MIKAKTRATTGMVKSENGFVVQHIKSKFWRWISKHRGSSGDRFWKIEKKLPFKIFREKMSNYISKTMKYGNKVVGIVDT